MPREGNCRGTSTDGQEISGKHGKILRRRLRMTVDDIQLLYEYDRWANNRALQACLGLQLEQFTRDLGGAFRSVRDTLVHIIGGEWGWLTYWKEPQPGSDS